VESAIYLTRWVVGHGTENLHSVRIQISSKSSERLLLHDAWRRLPTNQNPHFLFNTLNFYFVAIRFDPYTARKVIFSSLRLFCVACLHSNGFVRTAREE